MYHKTPEIRQISPAFCHKSTAFRDKATAIRQKATTMRRIAVTKPQKYAKNEVFIFYSKKR